MHDVGAKEEIAAVPEIAFIHVAGRGGAIRLLDEAFQLQGVLAAADRGAGLDVAVACRGMVRLDSERHDEAFGSRGGRLAAERDEAGLVLHHMICGQHGHDGVGRAERGDRGSDGDGRPGIAALRLEHDARLSLHLQELLAEQEPICMVRDDDRRVEHLVGKDIHRHLEGRLMADERDELFGQTFARLRPHPRARTPAHDYRQDLHAQPHLTVGTCLLPGGSRPQQNRIAPR